MRHLIKISAGVFVIFLLQGPAFAQSDPNDRLHQYPGFEKTPPNWQNGHPPQGHGFVPPEDHNSHDQPGSQPHQFQPQPVAPPPHQQLPTIQPQPQWQNHPQQNQSHYHHDDDDDQSQIYIDPYIPRSRQNLYAPAPQPVAPPDCLAQLPNGSNFLATGITPDGVLCDNNLHCYADATLVTSCDQSVELRALS